MKAARLASLVAALTALATLSAGCGGGTHAASAASKGGALTGVLRLTPGSCGAGGAVGSYFRMIQPNGTVAKGPFVSNGDSTCTDKTWSLLSPGADGGLDLGRVQPPPAKPFDGSGNATVSAIAKPVKFFAVAFGIFTDTTDRQTKRKVPVPSLTVDSAGHVTGNISAFQAAYNNAYYNQGAPKPDGTSPGITRAVTGTYDAKTGKLVIEWSSQIVGGAFNNFGGFWHLEGTLRTA
jgi:hypothetical protein